MWDDAEIKALNADVALPSLAIKVVHRVKGSSSTAGFTAYMQTTCPASWSLDTGSTISWPESTNEGQGSDGMSKFIEENEADIGAAATVALDQGGLIPDDPSDDWSTVNLYNLAGPTTWPITMISYFYLEKDLSGMDAQSAALLMAFVNFVLSEEGQAMAEDKLFVKLPTKMQDKNTATLASLTLPAGYTALSFEDSG